jgi:hypothetical protein
VIDTGVFGARLTLNDNREAAVIKLVISMDPVATGNPSSSALAEL